MRPKLTYANVMASIAVFIALGGASYAAFKLPKNSVGARQLKRNAVTLAKIAPSARASLKGPKGDLGPRGEVGLTGPAGGDGGFNGAAAGGDLTGTYPNPRVGLVQAGGGDESEDEGFVFLLPSWPDFAAITTDGDSDADNTVRILNIGSQDLGVRYDNGQAILDPGQSSTFLVGPPTQLFLWSADGARNWLVTCIEVLNSLEIRCQGLANRVG